MGGNHFVLHSLESIKGDVNLGSLVDLDHELYEERGLYEDVEVDTELAHFKALFEREIHHDPGDPEHPRDSPQADVALVLSEPLLPVCIYPVKEEVLQSREAFVFLVFKPNSVVLSFLIMGLLLVLHR